MKILEKLPMMKMVEEADDMQRGQVYEISLQLPSALRSHSLQCPCAEICWAFQCSTVVNAQRDARRRRGMAVVYE